MSIKLSTWHQFLNIHGPGGANDTNSVQLLCVYLKVKNTSGYYYNYYHMTAFILRPKSDHTDHSKAQYIEQTKSFVFFLCIQVMTI